MAWDTVMTIMVRHLIGDLDDDEDLRTYSDCRIKSALVVGGLLAAQDYTFSTEYTFDIDDPNISPDPTVTATYDAFAMALFSLKTACMLNTSEYQNTVIVGGGVRIKDGDSEVDTTGRISGFKDIIKVGPCESYKMLLRDKEFKNSMNRGKAVTTPMTHEDWHLRSSGYGRSVCNFFDNICGRRC